MQGWNGYPKKTPQMAIPVSTRKACNEPCQRMHVHADSNITSSHCHASAFGRSRGLTSDCVWQQHLLSQLTYNSTWSIFPAIPISLRTSCCPCYLHCLFDGGAPHATHLTWWSHVTCSSNGIVRFCHGRYLLCGHCHIVAQVGIIAAHARGNG